MNLTNRVHNLRQRYNNNNNNNNNKYFKVTHEVTHYN